MLESESEFYKSSYLQLAVMLLILLLYFLSPYEVKLCASNLVSPLQAVLQ